MKSKLIICSLLVGLITITLCLAGEQNQTLSESEMRATIGLYDCCDYVSDNDCGDPGDGCISCNDNWKNSSLDHCYVSAPSYFDESYHLCHGTDTNNKCIENEVYCAEYYDCDESYSDETECGQDPYGDEQCNTYDPARHCSDCESTGSGKGIYITRDDHECVPK